MLPSASLLAASLVPASRFGALLLRERTKASLSLLELSRACEHRWLPDQLLDIERGRLQLRDDEIEVVAAAYGVESGPYSSERSVRVVLDRSTAGPFLDAAQRRHLAAIDEKSFADRFVAVSVLVGLDITSPNNGIDVVAEALDLNEIEANALVRERLETRQHELGSVVADLRQQLTIPSVGVMVGPSLSGDVLVVPSPY